MIDLVDNNNQGRWNSNRPFDRLSGYTLKQVVDVLKDCSDLEDLRDELESNYNNSTGEHLNELFTQYINLEMA